jgi:hypothetical protein
MVRLSKKGIVLVAILITVVLGATGYLAWRVNEYNSIAPDDIDAAPPEDKENCGGCAQNGYVWKWVGGECKKRPDPSCKTKNQDPKGKKCNTSGAAGCKDNLPGAACGNDGQCVNISEESSGYKCACEGQKSDTPTTPTNSCEGGKMTIPAVGDKGTIGEPITISGYAFDADGVNKGTVNVSIDDVVVGTATAVDACPTGNASICSSVGAGKKPIVWTYSFTPTKESHDIVVSWADSKGATGTACTASQTLTSSEKEVTVTPDWSISSTASTVACQNTGGANVSGKVNYAVTIKNIGDGEGEISRIEVTLDDTVQESFLSTEDISPSATVSGNVITWSLSGSDAAFAADQTKVYEFSLDVPKASYGQFVHEVSITPGGEGAEVIDQTVDSVISCTDEGEPEVPETAIFDSAIGQIAMSLSLISLGYLYLKGYDKGLLQILGSGYRTVSSSYEGVFGQAARVERSRKKFEKRIK